ncbi:putative type I restriction enzymeP M protein [compost metagenome]
MVSLLSPTPNKSIIDPAVGTGTFLVNALYYMRENSKPNDVLAKKISDSLVGIDLDHSQTRISWVNLLLHGVESPKCVQGNSLIDQIPDKATKALLSKKYDFVLADLPFGGRVHSEDIKETPKYVTNTAGKTSQIELLFIMRALDLLKPGGRAAIIIPQSVLTGESSAQISLRRWLISRNQVEAVIMLPGKVFNPFVGIGAAILVIRKCTERQSKAETGAPPLTDAVWFYEISDDGVSVDPRDANATSAENDMLDALVHFENRTKSLVKWESQKDIYFESDSTLSTRTKFLHPDKVVGRQTNRTKQWQIPVRSWVENHNHLNSDGFTGSHDDSGHVRPDYVKQMTPKLYVADKLALGLLESDCIESQKWSLELSRYKTLKQPKSLGNETILNMIRELEYIERGILLDLQDLRIKLGANE